MPAVPANPPAESPVATYKYGFREGRPVDDAKAAAEASCRASRWIDESRTNGERYVTTKIQNKENRDAGEYMIRVDVLPPVGSGPNGG